MEHMYFFVGIVVLIFRVDCNLPPPGVSPGIYSGQNQGDSAQFQGQQQYQAPNNPAHDFQPPNNGVPQTHFESHPPQQQHRVLKDRSEMEQEQEHIKKHAHMDTSKMSEQERMFHYFKMHDADNNNKLDGTELYMSLHHIHGSEDEHQQEQQQQQRSFTDSELETMIDPILDRDDTNGDGCIDFSEFLTAQQGNEAIQS